MIIISNTQGKDELVAREQAIGETVFIEANDNAVLQRLIQQAIESNTVQDREVCYLVVNEASTLWLLQTIGVPDVVRKKFDILATTTEDLLAKMILVKLPNFKTNFPSLDREPISKNSDSIVHLVVFGYSAQTEALVLNAALVAHYPNYCRDTRLRTRITIIDDHIVDKSNALLQKYPHLFNNSYYRTLNLSDPNPQCIVHCPMYEGYRKDFVDIEWEFINGNIHNTAVRQKLNEWSTSSNQQLTIALCHDNQQQNINEAFCLPEQVYSHEIPILCNADESEMLQYAQLDNRFSHVYPFGRNLCNIDVLRDLKQLAKRVNYVYNHCFSLSSDEEIYAPASIDIKKMELLWDKIELLPKLYSNVFNAMTLGTKMHSIGHTSEDWVEYYALSKEEIDILTEVEHNRWNVEELLLGYRPTTDEEQQLIEEDMNRPKDEQKELKRTMRAHKIHYDLRSFDDLRTDTTGKNVNVYDRGLTQGIPLIIKSCITD